MSRFASITADILVRKGDAKPWHGIASADLPPAARPAPLKRDVVEVAEPVHGDCGPVRRCAIRLTPCEYQRLGILAVKKDVSRQEVLRQAVEAYLAAAEQDYGRACGCLTGDSHLR